MKRSSTQLKQMAKSRLQGKYGICVVAILLVNIASTIPILIAEAITGVAINPLNATSWILYLSLCLIISLIVSVLIAGQTKMFLNIARGEAYSLNDLFYSFRHHPDKIILANLLQLLLLLVCLGPGYGLYFYQLYRMLLSSSLQSFGMLCLALLFIIIGLVLYVTIMLIFSQVVLILVDNPSLGTLQAFRESRRLMRGNKGRLLYIELSFLGWIALATLSLGIGMLWVTPYMQITLDFFYLEITGELDHCPTNSPISEPYQPSYTQTPTQAPPTIDMFR